MKLRTLAILAGAGITLAACDSKDDGPTPPDANVTEITVPETPAEVNVSTQEPAAVEPANVAPVPEATPTEKPTPFSDREQTESDAAATGMTSRIDRSADSENQEKKQ
ncbi:hypothetical protein [Sphingomonas sp. TDK1]|uniref:hypothetical protein n=1 Tax=Sphingomonas sp. TDK1 TaxID=453247 RepID=UPI0007D9CDBE|nr:hypothetical protein [Sphingomonas sp. TDK1]OAN62835.1 hypothetical protein A7X12_21745 [Sphingomonas sp. TDK1]